MASAWRNFKNMFSRPLDHRDFTSLTLYLRLGFKDVLYRTGFNGAYRYMI